MPYNLVQAGAATGRDKSTVLKAIKRGAISATRDPDGGWLIEPAELHRIYPPVAPVASGVANATSGNRDFHHSEPQATGATSATEGEIRELRARLVDAHGTIDDLRARLDRADAERREAQEKLTAVLTDQRPGQPPARRSRSWWPWGRKL